MLTLEEVQELRVGEAVEIPPNAYVRRKGRADWVLIDRHNTERSRWGSAAEIHKDMEYFIAHGHLPPAKGEIW